MSKFLLAEVVSHWFTNMLNKNYSSLLTHCVCPTIPTVLHEAAV
jgi:hypothetical protein